MATIAEDGPLAETTRPPLVRGFVRRWARSPAARVVLVFAVCSALGGLFSLPAMTRASLRDSMAQWWAWGLVAPLIVWVDRKLPFSGKQLGRRAAAHAAANLFFVPLYLYIFFTLRALVGDVPWYMLWPAHIFAPAQFGWFLWSSLIYWMIVGALQAYRYYERYLSSELNLERLEKSYSQARLNALRMQLDPHFLFNALNTISSHVERNPRLTRRMIEHLGDLLRMSLESKDRQEVPLAEELAFLEHYLEIQRIRFGDQLQIDIDVAPEVRYGCVPSLLLQPLVENAIRHGISRRITGGWITVTARAVGSQLAIRVADDGVGLPEAWSLERSNGLGLSVTRERLAGLYPGQSHFAVRRRAEGGTEVEILMPLRVLGEENDA